VRHLAKMLHEIDNNIAGLNEFRDKPSGHIRITAVEHAAKTVLCPALASLLPEYPDISVEIIVDYGLVDVVADRFDAGVRLGEKIAKDMIAVRISPPIPMSIVAAPDYFATHRAPRRPEELVDHRCIGLRLPTSDGLYSWRFTRKAREVRVRINAVLIFNTIEMMLEAALRGLGVAYVPQDQVEEHLRTGQLMQVLEKWAVPLPGYHLYYPNRRHNSPAFRLVVDALRYRGKG